MARLSVFVNSRTAARNGRRSSDLGERGDGGFEAAGYVLGRSVRWEADGGADVYGDFVAAGKAPAGFFHLGYSVKPHGEARDAEIFGQQPDAWLEFGHAAVRGLIDDALGEDEEAVLAVGGFARELEAL